MERLGTQYYAVLLPGRLHQYFTVKMFDYLGDHIGATVSFYQN